jgi:hypothetical protein
MKSQINGLGLVLFLTTAPLAFSQEATPQPCPDVVPGSLGCELVLWSRLQAPVPLPEPDVKPVPPSDGHSPSERDQAGPKTTRQSITGTIVRQGVRCVLKLADNSTYQLDNQNTVKQYQDKKVKIVGTLDADNHTLHVESIEVAS